MPSTNPLRIPVALHSNQSAMTLLHTIPLALVITRRDRPGKWNRAGTARFHATHASGSLWVMLLSTYDKNHTGLDIIMVTTELY